MPLVRSFPETIDFINDWELVVRQKVKYKWKPTKCTQCQMLGHEGSECRRKKPGGQEWRRVIPIEENDKLNTRSGP